MNLKDYIRGQRQGKEANKLERKAMDDPFLQDAIDGYDSVVGDHISVIENLEKRLSSPQKRINKRGWIWAAAAVIMLLVGIPLLLKLPAEKEFLVASSEIGPKQPEIVLPPQQKDSVLETEELDSKVEESTIDKEYIAQNSKKDLFTEAKPPIPKEESTKTTVQNKMRIVQPEERAKSIHEPAILRKTHTGEFTENLEISQAREVRFSTAHDTFGISDIRVTSTPLSQQDQLLVSGRIVDETGEPIPGVSIYIPNTQIGAITDISGNFHLAAPKQEEVSLVATFIGMNDVNIPLRENVGDIVMKANNMALSEVVVVGHGVQKRRTFTGSISSIKEPIESKSTISTANSTYGAVSNEDRTTFAEEDFKRYFSENYDKEICAGQEIAFVVEFFIDPAGRPGNILIKENSCPALDIEIKRLLLGSPYWSDVNRIVNMRIELSD